MSATAARLDVQQSTVTRRISVLIADDHPLILTGIRRTLERSDDVEVIGEASSGPQVLAMIERRRPDVVLLDLQMPGVIGADCVAAIRRDWPAVKPIVLSAADDRCLDRRALNAGRARLRHQERPAGRSALDHPAGRERRRPSHSVTGRADPTA